MWGGGIQGSRVGTQGEHAFMVAPTRPWPLHCLGSCYRFLAGSMWWHLGAEGFNNARCGYNSLIMDAALSLLG